jgi:ubiquinone/menaquinone biosynthesis C-methylase UbiE
MTVMDVGCGMGYFSIGMAKLVGESGKIIAVDLQQKMLDIMTKRARKAGVAERIFPHRCEPDRIGVSEQVDFILTFYMVHEVVDQNDFFNQLIPNLAPGGKVLIAEPRFHVTPEEFEKTIQTARRAGLKMCAQPPIRFSLTALLEVYRKQNEIRV